MTEKISPPQKRVAGKVALVTGAGSGIGRATAVMLAAHGAAVCCADLNDATAGATASDIVKSGAEAWACRLDVTSEADWSWAMAEVLRRHGRLDIAVNCAGIAFASPVTEMKLADWRRVMAVNLGGVFLGTQHAVRTMRTPGHAGSIVNVSSISGIKAQPGASAYCASKAAVTMFSKTVALECLRNGEPIRVNTVSPAGVQTPIWNTVPFFQELVAKEGSEAAAFAAMARANPQGRFAMPEEIALAILYLASDESSYVTGTDLVIDNGGTA